MPCGFEPRTNRFYECPKCYNPDISAKNDVMICDRCGFGYDFKEKRRIR